MAFTVEDYRDLVQLLSKNPEWRSELRQLLLSDELLTLPEVVRGLAEAQQRAEVRLANVEDRLSKIETAIQHLTEQVRALTESQRQTENTVSRLKGESLEWSYHNKIYGYFGYLMCRLKVVDLSTIDEALEATLASGEFRDVFRLDLLAIGQ